MAKYSIIIPTLNHCEDLLKPCIESILKYTDMSQVEIIVSANGCTDGTRDYVECLRASGTPIKLVWSDEAIGYSRANNAAIKQASGEYLVLLNNDTVLLPQEYNAWIEILEKPFKGMPNVGITGPQIMRTSHDFPWPFLVFFCVMLSRKFYDELGGIDEIFGKGGGEDTDMSFKATLYGYTIVQVGEGKFPIWHKEKTTLREVGYTDVFTTNEKVVRGRYGAGTKFDQIMRGLEFPIVYHGNGHFTEHETYKALKAHILSSTELRGAYKNPERTLIVTFSNFAEKTDFELTAEYLGYKVIVLAKECTPWKHTDKIVSLSNYLNSINLDEVDYIISCDSRDSLVVGSLDEAIKRFKRFRCGIVFNAERNCWPIDKYKPSQQQIASRTGDELKYLNSGCFIGTAKAVKAYYNEAVGLVGKCVPPWCDQIIMQTLFCKYYPDIRIDYKNLIFQCMWLDEAVKDPAIKLDLKPTVTAMVSTRNRYYKTLPLLLQAIATQTVKPKEILIYDDGDRLNLREEELYQCIFKHLEQAGIAWKVLYGEGKGQIFNHQRSITDASGTWIWRIDDDNIPENNVLETLLSNVRPGVGAVAGLVLDPRYNPPFAQVASNDIRDIDRGLNMQWFRFGKSPVSVDHLYSTFIFNVAAAKKVGGYCMALSKVGHREETIFTHEIKRAGYELIVDPRCVTWHYRFSSGGIRDNTKQEMFAHDEYVFRSKLAQWGVTLRKPMVVVLDSGIGDHYAFKNIWPLVKAKYKDAGLILAVCYGDVFVDEVDVPKIGIGEARMLLSTEEFNKYNIYKWMYDRDWKGSIVEAYKTMLEV